MDSTHRELANQSPSVRLFQLCLGQSGHNTYSVGVSRGIMRILHRLTQPELIVRQTQIICNMTLPFHRLSPIDLGAFRVESGRIVVSDPSYDSLTLETPHCRQYDVAPGEWRSISIQHAYKYQHETVIHCAELVAHHKDNTAKHWDCSNWFVSIDTSQAGFFDSIAFCNDESVPADVLARFRTSVTYDNDRPWYSYCCEMTAAHRAAVIHGGVVSDAGFGDGAAMLYTQSGRKGLILGLRLVFIDEQGNV